MISVLRRASAAWLLLIGAESLHGTLRELFLRPYVGDLRARQLALLTGSAIIVAVACAVTRWIRAETPKDRWLVGLLWVALTLSFEVGFGRFILGYSWDRLLEDYDVTRGGWLWLGMIVLLLSPHMAAKVRPPRARQAHTTPASPNRCASARGTGEPPPVQPPPPPPGPTPSRSPSMRGAVKTHAAGLVRVKKRT